MPKTIRYIGTQNYWPEVAYTGRPTRWMPGMADECPDNVANALLATGLFRGVLQSVYLDSVTRQAVDAAGNAIGGGAPIVISGVPAVGNTLTATISPGWRNSGGNWTRDGANISGATALTYPLVSADNDKDVTYASSNIPYTPPALRIGAAAPVAPGAPTIGTATAGDGVVNVVFTAPASTGGSSILEYQAELSNSNTLYGSASPIAVPSANGAAVTGRVRARNAVDWGPWSANSNSVTPSAGATVPGQPAAPTATAGDGTVSLAFAAPSTGGSPILEYGALLSNGNINTGTPTGSPVSVASANGAAVTGQVRARNAVGWGPYSDPSNSVTPVAAAASVMSFARLSSNGQQETNTDSYTHFNDRHSVVNRAGVPVNQIVLRFSNTAATGASLNNGSQPVTISVGIGPESGVQATGTLTRALFPGGGNTYTLAPGEFVDTLPVTLAADIAHNAAMCVMVHSAYTTAPALLNASCTPSSRPTVDVNEGGIGIANKASGGSITGRYLNRHINGPIAVFATPVGASTLKSIAVFGDSIAAGANDSTTGGGLTGFIQRSLATTAVGVAYSTTAQSGYSWNAAFSGSPSDDFIRKAHIVKDGAYTHALMCLGGNDVKDGVTAASIQTRMLAAKAWFLARGIKMIPMTGLPRTNSTNTGPNTSDDPGAMTQYLLMNDNIRNNVGGVSEFGYFDRHAALADPSDPTRWRTDLGGNVYDTDGIHLLTLGHTTLTNALSAAAPTLFV